MWLKKVSLKAWHQIAEINFMKTDRQIGRKSFTCLSTPFTIKFVFCLYSPWGKSFSSNSNIRGKKKATNHTQNKTKKIPPQTNKNLPCQKTPSTIGNYISALLMLTKSSDLNQVCASETLVSHVSHNILKQLNHEHSMSELPLGVTELS